MEVLRENRPIILDGAHNEDGARALATFIQEDLKDYKIMLVVGMIQDKDESAFLLNLLPYVTKLLQQSHFISAN